MGDTVGARAKGDTEDAIVKGQVPRDVHRMFKALLAQRGETITQWLYKKVMEEVYGESHEVGKHG